MSDDRGAPISYLVLQGGTPVFAADGAHVGEVERVLAAPEEDVFDGLILDTPGGDRFVDADHVGDLHERAAMLTLSEAECDHLPDPTAQPAAMDARPDDAAPATLGDRLRRAWDLVSGRY